MIDNKIRMQQCDSDFVFHLNCTMMGNDRRAIRINHEFHMPDTATHQDVADHLAVFLRALQFELSGLRVEVDNKTWTDDAHDQVGDDSTWEGRHD
jgi:hypothetical protein